ncbi:MAG: peptidyl-prolyl cis-trans isomerase [Clostridia bacterium]|nr:peptidyl-prolyl cis-trans isomerase [Clostridia bacterium]
MKKLSLLSLIIAALFMITSCNIIINTPDTSSDTTTEVIPEETYAHSNMVTAPLDDIVATTEMQQFPVSTFKYFFMQDYNSFLDNYYYYLSYYGLDTNVPLHDQEYSGEEGMSWYDVFLDNGKRAFEQYAKFAEMALKEGMSLDEGDNAEIEAYLDSIEAAARDYGETFDQYISEFMGEGMNRERVRNAISLSQLGYKYYLKLYNGPVYTDEQLEKAYTDGAGAYSLIDYNEAVIEALYDETDDEEAVKAAKEEAKAKAEQLKKLVEEGKSFTEAYNELISVDDDGSEGTNEMLVTGAAYSSLEKFAFIYEKETVEGQINITYDDSGNATVIQCVKLPYKNTLKLVDVRHILLTSTEYNTEDEAYAKAQELVEKIVAATDKIDEITKLAAEFSEDPGSKTNGGLYEDVPPGEMVEEFNDWCFDPERQVGDIGIVKTSYGYHVMFLDGFGEELWRYNCDAALRDAEFTENADRIYAEITVTYNEDLLDRIVK